MLAQYTTIEREASLARRSRTRRSRTRTRDAEDDHEHGPPSPFSEGEEEGSEGSSAEDDPFLRGRSRYRHTLRPEEPAYPDQSGLTTVLKRIEPRPEIRRWQAVVCYSVFVLLGASILLPWNCVIVAANYFHIRLKGSSFQNSFSSWVAVVFSLGNCFFLFLATMTRGDPLSRTRCGLLVVLAGVGFLTASTQMEYINPSLFFVFLMALSIVLSAATSYLQNAVVATASRFGPSYLQGVLSGQGAIAVVVSGGQFLTAYAADRHQAPGDGAGPDSIKASAFSFFSAVFVFALIVLASHFLLTHQPAYIPLMAKDTPTSDANHSHAIRSVERKVRRYGLSTFFVFGVTLAVFPAITSSVLSLGQVSGRLADPTLFIPLSFILFAVGDWLGRVVSHVPALVFTDWRLILAGSVSRVVFVPLFLLCNVDGASSDPLIASDYAFLVIMFAFSLTNGYFATLSMLAGIMDDDVDEDEVDHASACLGAYLTTGLALGSVIGFPVRAAVCHCSPF